MHNLKNVRCLKQIRFNSNSTHFGFRNVAEGEKQGLVSEVFHKVADKYDLMNDAMSFGVHRLWKECFVSQLDPKPGCNYIDLAGGTGDIARLIGDVIRKKATSQNVFKDSNILVCDINSSMLKVGQERFSKLGHTYPKTTFLEQNAEKLESVEGNTYDAYTISFGIRNVPRISAALNEAYRVLKPGGVFMCLEFSHVENQYFKEFYDFYSYNVIPQMGRMISGDADSYQYLVESIRKFPTQEEFKEMITDAGFKYASYRNMTGGIVAIHRGIKI